MFEIESFFINADAAVERRETFLKNFANNHFSGQWHLARFVALSPDLELIRNISATLPPHYVARSINHLECLRKTLSHDRDAVLFEDDTVVGPHTERLVHILLSSLPEDAWDIIFLNASITNAVDWPRFFKMKKRCQRENVMELVNLQGFQTAYCDGLSAYLVNKKSKSKVFNALYGLHLDPANNTLIFKNAMDMVMRSLVYQGILRGFLTVPFVTVVADFPQTETAPQSLEARLTNAFRRLMWVEQEDSTLIRDGFKQVQFPEFHGDIRTLGEIVGMQLTRQMPWSTPNCQFPAAWSLPLS